jgi:hypothetical protein
VLGVSPVMLSRLAVRKPIGLYVGDREVTLCRAALTPLGPVELSCESEAYDDPVRLPEVFERLLRPHLGRRGSGRIRVGLGLPATSVFFATRSAQMTDRESTPAVMLHGLIRSSDIKVDDMQIEVVRSCPEKQPLVSLVACRRKHLAELLGSVLACKVRLFRAEPAPFALLRVGMLHLRAPRRASSVIRIFLGPTEGVALLLQRGMPVAWRTFDLPLGGERAAVLSTTMALRVASRHCGGSGSPDAVLIHGRIDLEHLFTDDIFAMIVGCRSQHTAEPSFDGHWIALGLAMGCREAVETVDLSRTIKARPPVWEVIPFGQMAAQAAVLAGFSWMLGGHLNDVRGSYKLVRAECEGHAWMKKVSNEGLAKEKAELEKKVAAVKGFLETRVVWSTYTRDAATRLSESMVLRAFSGNCAFEAKDGGASKKSLVLSVTAPIPQGQSMPREIDTYLDVLKSDEILRRDFPQVELGGLKWSQGSAAGLPQASFAVNCLPSSEKAAVKAAEKPAEKAK